MPGFSFKLGRRKVFIDFVGEYKPGDQPPEGYCDWHEWAAVQEKSGLRQSNCTNCGKWKYPQEVCCNAPRLSIAETKQIEREAAAFVKKNYPSQEEKYKREIRKRRKAP